MLAESTMEKDLGIMVSNDLKVGEHCKKNSKESNASFGNDKEILQKA